MEVHMFILSDYYCTTIRLVPSNVLVAPADQELQDIREEGDPKSEPLAASFDSVHQGGMSQFYSALEFTSVLIPIAHE